MIILNEKISITIEIRGLEIDRSDGFSCLPLFYPVRFEHFMREFRSIF